MIKKLFSKIADIVCFILNTWSINAMQFNCKHEPLWCYWWEDGDGVGTYVCSACGKVMHDE